MNQLKELSDQQLTQLIITDNKAAYQALFEKYAPRIYNFSKSYLENPSDAEELVQEVFLKIWDKRSILDTNKNVKSFIFKIAVNTIYDFVRRKNLQHAYEDYARLNYSVSNEYTWHEVIFTEMKQNLNTLLAQLPDQQQKVFLLSKVEGLTNNEIADKLNLSKRTVENHLYRAISFLKKHFKEQSLLSFLFIYIMCG